MLSFLQPLIDWRRDMSSHHHHDLSGKKLFIAVVLNIIITVAQIIGGILSGSLALLSDALHNFSDVLSLLISYYAHRIAHKRGGFKQTFGYKRAEILATLFNASVLIAIGIYLIYESSMRIAHPEPIASQWVIWLGLLGVLVNGGSIFLLHSDSRESMNIKAAYLHLLGDVLTSVAVVVGGLMMYYWGIYWIDPLISILIAFYLIFASVGLVMESSDILMQFAPKEVDIRRIAESVKAIKGVENIHHVHIWNLSDHEIFLEAHIAFSENLSLKEATEKITRIESLLKEKFAVTHTTLQAEYHKCDDTGLVQDDVDV